MERLSGFSFEDVAGMQAAGIDTAAVVRALMICFLEGAVLFGVFHGDLHGGNLFVRPDGTVALLDYGITGRLDEPRRLAFLRMLMGGTINDPKLQLAALRDLGALPADTDLDAVIRDLGIDQPVKDPTAMAPEELLARDPRDHQAPPRLRGPLPQGAHALRQGPALPRRGSGHAGTRRRPVRRGHPHRRLFHRLATGSGSPPKSASIPASTASTSTACEPSWASLPTWSA